MIRQICLVIRFPARPDDMADLPYHLGAYSTASARTIRPRAANLGPALQVRLFAAG